MLRAKLGSLEPADWIDDYHRNTVARVYTDPRITIVEFWKMAFALHDDVLQGCTWNG
jgi:hypothetical protein